MLNCSTLLTVDCRPKRRRRKGGPLSALPGPISPEPKRRKGGPRPTLGLIGDNAYDSDRLDRELADTGVEMIAP